MTFTANLVAAVKGAFEGQSEYATQAKLGTPAVAGTFYGSWTGNGLVLFLTGVYVVVQIAYLLRKWYREEKSAKANE